jgi:putative PIN family toxin of toxin-antitoxin system
MTIPKLAPRLAEAMTPPRVVLDTNVSLALFAWADPGCALLATALNEQRLRAVANVATRAEWQRILERPELRLDATVRACAAAAFDELVVDVETEHSPAPLALPRCRDRDDQMFLELARDAGAIALYSRDRELLKLSRRTQRHAGFAVLRPEDHRD